MGSPCPLRCTRPNPAFSSFPSGVPLDIRIRDKGRNDVRDARQEADLRMPAAVQRSKRFSLQAELEVRPARPPRSRGIADRV